MIAFAGLVWLSLAQAPEAAQVPPEPPAEACALADAPVVEIGARVRARSLKFTQAGDTEVRIHAEPGGEGAWKLDRGSLPDPIPVGKTFRNIDVRLNAEAHLSEAGLALQADAAPSSERPAPCN
ncbi:MAG TPA: hypothetical protein VEA44_11165 [Caulobacter sp.]|nr:hypothetical protein [Caulobacter sp.]